MIQSEESAGIYEKIHVNVLKQEVTTKIVFSVRSKEVLENTTVSLSEKKVIKVNFPNPSTFTIEKSDKEHSLPLGEGFIEITSNVRMMPGTNFCLIQVENTESIKTFKSISDLKLIIDIFPEKQKIKAEPLKKITPQQINQFKRSISSIVIDPGHGGYDRGIYNDEYREKDIVLNIGREIAKSLAAKDKKVFITRKVDQRLPLKERISIANSKMPDLFISLHLSLSEEGFIYSFDNSKDYNESKAKIANEIAINIVNNLKKDLEIDMKHEELPLPLLIYTKSPALLIELPHFKKFSYKDKEKERLLINSIIKSFTLKTTEN
ncbi:MAG: N-acetylmuramoyl-L-alanine amidase [Thermodesulfovibrionales bacterium]|nr:N-acetylmuramoyl-L-alanine amidase [Thermodesulfovibrionales bacterium]